MKCFVEGCEKDGIIYFRYGALCDDHRDSFTPDGEPIDEFFGEPISVYTSGQAEEDGLLFPVKDHQLFNYITTNLMYGRGYMVRDGCEEHVNIPNLIDLLNQARLIMVRNYQETKEQDHFYSGLIEFPSGVKGKIFMAQNESGKYTIMLPEDY